MSWKLKGYVDLVQMDRVEEGSLKSELRKHGLIMRGEERWDEREEWYEEHESDLLELKAFKLEELRTAIEGGVSWWVREVLEECVSYGGYVRSDDGLCQEIRFFDVEKDLVPLLEEAMMSGRLEAAREISKVIRRSEMVLG